MKMESIICYDIVEDKKRAEVAKICQNKGFSRIQYSVYFGDITRNVLESTMLEIGDILKGYEGNVVAIEICEKCAKKKKTIQMKKEENKQKDEGKGEKENGKELKKKKKKKKKRNVIDKERMDEIAKKGVIML